MDFCTTIVVISYYFYAFFSDSPLLGLLWRAWYAKLSCFFLSIRLFDYPLGPFGVGSIQILVEEFTMPYPLHFYWAFRHPINRHTWNQVLDFFINQKEFSSKFPFTKKIFHTKPKRLLFITSIYLHITNKTFSGSLNFMTLVALFHLLSSACRFLHLISSW